MGAFLDKPKTEKTSHVEIGSNLSYGLSAMQGWRIDMEDAHTAELSLQTPFQNWSFFGVYDGHAGSVVSDICSRKLLPSILETPEMQTLELDETGSPINLQKLRDGIRNGFLMLDKAIGESSEVESGEDKSGSTVISVFVTPKHIIFANCGDSRGMLVRNSSVHFNTEDHKPMNPSERDRIQKAGGTVMIQRINGSLAVSRSLGDFDYKKVETKSVIEQLVSPEPEITVIERSLDEDQMIVLACDGIWDVMSNEELSDYILNRCSRIGELHRVCEEVLDLCLYKGSRDNMSIVIVTTKNIPKFDKELSGSDHKLNEAIRQKIQDYVACETNDLDINSLLTWLQGHNLGELPPGGLTAKRGLIDPLFEELCKDKQKPQNNSSDSNHTLSVLSLLSAANDGSPAVFMRRTGADSADASKEKLSKSKTM